MTPALVVAAVAGGALGALARYGVSLTLARPRARLPWAVLVVNVAGSALGGVLLALAAHGTVDPGIRFVLFGGVAGGLTTFSTLSVETLQLLARGRRRAAAASVAANLALGVGAAAAGFAVTTALGTA